MNKTLQILLGLVCVVIIFAGGAAGWNWWKAKRKAHELAQIDSDVTLMKYICDERKKAYDGGKSFDETDTRIGNELVMKYGYYKNGEWYSLVNCVGGFIMFNPPAPAASTPAPAK